MIDAIHDIIFPSDGFIQGWRLFNIFFALVICLTLWFAWGRTKWRTWKINQRLGFMALFWLCFTGFYGSLEVAFFDTALRLPMVTVSLCWAGLAALWPRHE